MKKFFKILGGIIALLIIAIIAIPFLFKDTIKEKIRIAINEQVNATVDFGDVDISLISNFPKASVAVEQLSVINKAPFEGDTLVYSKHLGLSMSIMELFKSADEPISINTIIVDEALVNIKTDSLGNANYDIAKASETAPTTPAPKEEERGGSFVFDLNHVAVNNSNFHYIDEKGKINAALRDFNLIGKGSVSGDQTDLDLDTNTKVSVAMDNTEYLTNNHIDLKAIIGMDLKNQRYSFKENEAHINQLPLAFDGFVQLNEKNTEVDLSFATPGSDFKNFLAVIPKAYAKSLDGVKTSGDFGFKGVVKGIVDDTHIPTLDIAIMANDASFKYPELPKSVRNINLATQIKNTTGLVKDTYVLIDKLAFTIDQDAFSANGSFKNLTENMLVDLTMNGSLNLSHLDQAYPLELEQDLNGMLKANIHTHFDMNSLEKEQYQKVTTTGNMTLTDFKYSSPDLPNELQIKTASVDFKPETITLDKMNSTMGKSDLEASGAIHNLMGFLFAKQDLKGVFDVNSNVFAVSDFMVASTESTSDSTATPETETPTETTTTEETLKIPSFIDATLNFKANTVYYDNLTLKNTKGSVKIKDETAALDKVSSDIFGGTVGFTGNVSTKEQTPSFGMNLDLSKINIAQSFTGLDLMKGLAPIAKALDGVLSTQINLSGDLSQDLTPILTSLKGNALAEILNAKVNSTQTPLLNNLNQELNFINLDKLNLKKIKTKLSFDDGKINIKPFDFKIEDIGIKVAGSHGFDMNMNYDIKLDLPAKYLGKEVTKLLAQVNPSDANKMTVGVPLGVSGNFTNPKINLDTKDAVQQLTQQLIAKQKDKVKDELLGKGTDLIGDLLGGKKEDKKEDGTTNNADNTQTNKEEAIKDAAKDILGGLFGKKKKKKEEKKDN